MTIVQEKQGAKKYALPKELKNADIVKRDTYNLDDMALISSDTWSASCQTPARLPSGVKNTHTVFTYRASADVEVEKPIGRLPETRDDCPSGARQGCCYSSWKTAYQCLGPITPNITFSESWWIDESWIWNYEIYN
eukprot:3405269-Amphidinium_carterae.1